MDDLRAELADLAEDLRQQLAWQRLLGVKGLPPGPPLPELVLDAPPPADRTEPPARPAPSPRSTPSAAPPRPPVSAPRRPPAPPASPRPPTADHTDAWAALGQSEPQRNDLTAVRQALGDCKRCRLCESRSRIVFGVGDPHADLVVVGEGPGANEDREGVPFVGPAGQMLDRMLVHVLGLKREQVYILNVVKCRPPRNRTPQPDEIAACRPFLLQQLEAIQPKVILAMGRPATQTLMETQRGIKAMRGRWQRYRGGTPLMPTFHPAYLLRQPQDKRLTFEDLKAVRLRYDELGGRR